MRVASRADDWVKTWDFRKLGNLGKSQNLVETEPSAKPV